MPDIFADSSGNDYHLSITTSTDWTVSGSSLPNGDASTSGDGTIAPTYNLTATAFHLASGAWTIEFWIRLASVLSTGQRILDNGPSSSTTDEKWVVDVDSSERINFSALNSTGAVYMGVTSNAMSALTWYHVVILIPSGGTPTCYLNNASSVSSSVARTGTAKVPDATDRLFFGTRTDGSLDLDTTVRIAKLAIYDREITTGEISNHYLAMTT